MIAKKRKMMYDGNKHSLQKREAYIKFNRTNVNIVKQGLTQNITQVPDD